LSLSDAERARRISVLLGGCLLLIYFPQSINVWGKVAKAKLEPSAMLEAQAVTVILPALANFRGTAGWTAAVLPCI
jgi:hypothetical protein